VARKTERRDEYVPSLTVYLPESVYARLAYLSLRRNVELRRLVKEFIIQKLEEEEKKEKEAGS